MKRLALFVIIIFSITACLKQNFYSGKINLNFSTDTVFFDTIFTHVGSTTHRLLVYNPYPQPVKIDKIFLAGGQASSFRLNIDGLPSLEAHDVIIDANDSMYIFVEVTINPAKDNLLVKDSIVFVSGENIQDVKLLAVGRDVHLLNGRRLRTQTWTNDKPYLIFNSVLVDSNEVLTIEAGTEIYSHRGSYIYVYGTIKVNGTKETPVLFAGDRLEQDYNNLPGQWGGIRLLPGSHDNFFNYAIIKDAVIGIEIDTLTNPDEYNTVILNSKIQHHSFAGIYALATKTLVANTLISDCGYYNVALLLGGEHYFIHCTIQNDYRWIIRKTPSVVFNNYLTIKDKQVFWGPLTAFFANTIIYGDQKNEFYPDAAQNVENGMTFSFKNCLLKIDNDVIDTTASFFEECIFNKDPEFVYENDSLEYFQNRNYGLSSGSPAIDKADRQIVEDNAQLLQYDLDGYDRLSDGKPDIGAYEYH